MRWIDADIVSVDVVGATWRCTLMVIIYLRTALHCTADMSQWMLISRDACIILHSTCSELEDAALVGLHVDCGRYAPHVAVLHFSDVSIKTGPTRVLHSSALLTMFSGAGFLAMQ